MAMNQSNILIMTQRTHEQQVWRNRTIRLQGLPGRKAAKSDIKIATWNVRTMFEPGKLRNFERELMRVQGNILGIIKTKRFNSGHVTT